MELAPPDTLIVRRLPEALTVADLNELFLHFGAQSATRQYFRGKKTRSNVLVKFPTHEDATLALIRLHQQTVMGKRLIVEYANFSFLPPPKLSPTIEVGGERDLGSYVPANEAIVQNIASLLLAQEEFYLRVLQLIKLMGLKLSCSGEHPIKSPPKATNEILSDTPIEEVDMEELYKEDTEESELESEHDSVFQKDTAPVPELPKRCKKLKLRRLDRLRTMKIAHSVSQTSSKKEKIIDVFEHSNVKSDRKLNVKITTDVSTIVPLTESCAERVSGFGLLRPSVAVDKNTDQSDETIVSTPNANVFITEQTLHVNKLNDEEKNNLPVFKNYSPGVPNSRLYIKNIAKGIKDEDLKFIYGRYVDWESEEERNMFDIRLMTEGRMKGQAFITLPNVRQAEKALSETNGYVLHGKPFVVQFARAAVAKDSSNTTE